jgi:hypothetical protein
VLISVCPHRDIGAALVLPYANAQAINLHLEEIGSQVAQGTGPSGEALVLGPFEIYAS